MSKNPKNVPFVETSRWKFEMDSQPNLAKIKSAVVHNRKESSVEINQVLEEETPKDNLLQIQIKENDFHPESSQTIPNDNKEHFISKLESVESEKLISLREPEAEPNPYLVLLNRLDEEEGIRVPSIEDKLKVTEDRLRLSTLEFVSTCEQLMGFEEQDKAEVNRYLQPMAVKEALSPKVFESSLRPPRTFNVKEFKGEVNNEEDKGAFQTKNAMQSKKKQRKYPKQEFYTSPDIWFGQEKHEEQMTQEELELLNSTTTKAFLKFLNDRKKEPPRILQDIQKKVTDMKKENKNVGKEKSDDK